jgi:hypothetical protein
LSIVGWQWGMTLDGTVGNILAKQSIDDTHLISHIVRIDAILCYYLKVGNID